MRRLRAGSDEQFIPGLAFGQASLASLFDQAIEEQS